MKLASVRAHDPETIRVLGLERYPTAVGRPVRRLGGACDLGELLDPQTALLDRIDLSSAPKSIWNAIRPLVPGVVARAGMSPATIQQHDATTVTIRTIFD